MSNSFRLFRIWGIDIRVHITFPLILIWAGLSFGLMQRRALEGALFGIIVTLILFAIVVLHELGHSYAAQQYGVQVKQIVLLPIGGVAQMARIPERPLHEFVIAIAGPLVNFALAIVLALLAPSLLPSLGAAQLTAFFGGMGRLSFASVFGYVYISNLFLAVFNLIPAFPLDGGRVLRALLATRLNYSRATAIAVVIGQIAAWLLGLWGFLSGNLFLIIIAIFIFAGAGQEGQLVQLRSVLGDITVEQAYSRRSELLDLNTSLGEAVEVVLRSFQSHFAVGEGNRLVGILTYRRLVESLAKIDKATPIREVMQIDLAPVKLNEKLFAVQQRMAEDNADALPVVEGDEYLGLITSQDINEAYRLFAALTPSGEKRA